MQTSASRRADMLLVMQQIDASTRQRKRKNYIQEWMDFRGFKPADVLEATGAGKDLAWKWRTQDNFPTEEYLASLLDLLQTERECLFAPPPGRRDEGKGGAFYFNPSSEETADRTSVTQVPVVSMVSAGRLKPREGVSPSEVERWMPVANLPKGDWLALVVDGDSMDRVAPDQSAILVNRADSTLIDGRFYVFNLENGETTFKTFRRDPMRLQPYSMNPDHMSIPVASTDDLYVIGRVKIVIQEV